MLRPLPRTPSSDRNPLEDNITNEEQIVIKQVIELQDNNGSWNLTDTLANLISIPNHIQIANSLSTDTEKRLVATTLVLSYLNYFHYVSESDIQFSQVIEKANHWVKETQRRSVALPSTLENSISATIIDSMFIDDQLTFKFHIVMVGNEWYITRSLQQIQEFRNSLLKESILNKTIDLIQLPQDSYYDNDEEYYNKINIIDSFFKQVLENKDILLNGAALLDSILAPKQIGDIDYEGVEITIQLVIDEKWSNISNQIKEILTSSPSPLLSPNSAPNNNKTPSTTSNSTNTTSTTPTSTSKSNITSPNTSNANLSSIQSPTPSKINRRKSFWDRVFFQSLTADDVEDIEESLIKIDLTLQPSIAIPLLDDRTRVAYGNIYYKIVILEIYRNVCN